MDGLGSAPWRRSGRDCAVDAAVFLGALGYGTVLSLLLAEDPTVPRPVLVVTQVFGAVGCALLWSRRRWPTGVALVLIPLSVVSDVVHGALLVALFTVAVHRPVPVTAVVATTSVLGKAAFLLLVAGSGEPVGQWLLFVATSTFAVVGWGLFARHRRQLVLSLRERAERAETEARLRAEQAQHHARAQIAREMHDVLGHRLSLLSVQAGALEYRPNAPATEIARAVRVIRASAHQALQDLREVLAILRTPVTDRPQPTLADVPDLVAESVHAGMRVELSQDVTGTVAGTTGRTAFRIVQEGLTNARKHAPGSHIRVTVAGAPARGVTIEVHNDAPAEAPTLPGGGQGLVGLAERVTLAAGRLDHQPTASGGFRLAAWLPWPS
ncbi:MAG TPA: histidine kinase [Actinophytocola sp.]|uniref:sensor histidine kinase n=1 Tax=Actinophytocola sp. TaxID=1872138 RepID=UPI002DB71DE1|nr:histidine kinase [Actinophytocola sp.]HEU5473570.1 histidine kinase [Actinophytocola sp.]